MHRIGLLIPSSNTVMEPDFQRAFDGLATVHSARLFLPEPFTIDDELRMIDEFADRAARDIGTVQPDLVVFGCTSAGALRGPGYDRTLREELSEKAGAPVVGILDTMAEALRQAGCNRLAVLTPYVEELNTAIRASLEADGFEIAAITGLGLRSNLDVGRVPPGAIAEFVLAGTPDDAEGVAIACTNFRAFEARELIATRTGRPVVTANASVVDAVRERLALA